eukprot:scaffold101184_cov68-Cyclotella_meneghiniana.AAC.7
MKCIQYSEHGGDYASTFQCIETETSPSDPPASFALVKVHAAAGNPIDFKVAKGELNGAWDCPLPMIMGYDFSGVIVGVGEGNDAEFQVGDEVFAVTWGQGQHKPAEEGAIVGGAFADYITVPTYMLSKKPKEISHEQAAAIALVGTTAYQALFNCLNVKEGDKILILGGPTSVGSLAIQLAKNAGAWVATTSSERNVNYVKNLQPDLIIDYRKEDWSNHPSISGIDAVFDAVGETGAFGKCSGDDSKVIKKGGRFVSIANFDAGFDPKGHQPQLEFASFFCLTNSSAVQDKLAADLVNGKLKVDIDKTFEFSKDGAVEMMKYIESGKGRGKNVMNIVS